MPLRGCLNHVCFPAPIRLILPDCLSIVFSYHIQPISHNHTHYSATDLLFFSRHILCWEFHEQVNVREFLVRTRGNKLTLQYVCAVSNGSLDTETFKLFRGIRELNVERMYGHIAKFTDEAMENLRGIEILNISGCHQLTSACFVNLRGIKELSICVMGRLDDSVLELLRGIQRLDLQGCRGFTNEGMANLRGIKSLVMDCDEFTHTAFENFRGVHELGLIGSSRLSPAVLANFRGVKVLHIHESCNIPDHALKNLIGIEELSISPCPQLTDFGLQFLVGVKRLSFFNCHQITGSGLQHIRGVQQISLWNANISENCDFSPFREATNVQLSNITLNDQILRNLRRAKEFHASGCSISDDALFTNLSNVERLQFYNMNLLGFTDEAFRHLRNLRIIYLNGCHGGYFTKRLEDYIAHRLEGFAIQRTHIALQEDVVDEVAHSLAHIPNLNDHSLPDDGPWGLVLEKWKAIRGEV